MPGQTLLRKMFKTIFFQRIFMLGNIFGFFVKERKSARKVSSMHGCFRKFKHAVGKIEKKIKKRKMMEGDYEIRTDLPSARARRLESDEPLPKVYRYVSHFHPPSFYFSRPFRFFTAYLNFQKTPLHARNFSSTFSFFYKNPKIFPSMKILWKINLSIFRSKVWPGTKVFKTYGR